MKQRLCNFESACLLKEIGYNEGGSFYVYTNSGELFIADYLTHKNEECDESDTYKCVAPTQQDATDFILDRFGVHIQPEPYCCEDGRLWLAKILELRDGYSFLMKTILVCNDIEEVINKSLVWFLSSELRKRNQ